MENLTMKLLVDRTRRVIQWIHGGIPAQVLPYLHPDIVWINDLCCQHLYGYPAVSRGLMAGAPPGATDTVHHYYHMQQLKTDLAVITGHYRLEPMEGDKSVICGSCHLTFVWRTDREEGSLLHAHLSQERAVCSSDPPLIFREVSGASYYLPPNEIVYIEARNMKCGIHCNSTMFLVSQPINRLGGALPQQFLRIHRSFIVNRIYVSRIYRYTLELTNGVCLPVPEKRYMDVLCRLEERPN